MKIFLQNIPDSHRAFIEKKGWRMASYFPKNEPFEVPEYPEALQTYKLANVDFKGYENTSFTQHTYRLKQTCDNRYLEAVILSSDNKIVDSYISVSETEPGITEMSDQEIYMEEHCLN
jgi:hypothetical protein